MSKPVRPPRPKIPWRRVDGVLLLDKPGGLSSNDALQRVRRVLLAEKGGHTGTLDPMATGLLPLCFGEATKFSHDLLEADKTYLATVKLGERTNTGDAEGEVIERKPVNVEEEAISAALSRFIGPILQVPPMHSALKRDGVPLYKLARQGIEVERVPRQISIRSLRLTAVAHPFFSFEVCCSKGTYVRSLAEDIGDALGCGAHLTALRRTRVGLLDVADAVSIDHVLEFAGRAVNELHHVLKTPDSLVAALPAVRLAEAEATRFCNGNAVSGVLSPEAPVGQLFRVYAGGERFLGLGECVSPQWLHPRRVVAN